MKDDPSISIDRDDDALEQKISDAVGGDQRALDALMLDPWMMALLCRLAEWARYKKHIEADAHGKDIQDIIAERIREQIRTVKNPHERSWRACLTSWAYFVARTCCAMARRSMRAEQLYRDEVEHARTIRKQGGVRIFAPAAAMSPQEELEEREQAPLRWRMALQRRRRELKIRRAARNVFASLPSDEAQILSLWTKGLNYRQTHEASGIPLSTVGKKLPKLLKVLFKEISKLLGEGQSEGAGVALLAKDKKNWDGIRQLIAHSLSEPERRDREPRAGV